MTRSLIGSVQCVERIDTRTITHPPTNASSTPHNSQTGITSMTEISRDRWGRPLIDVNGTPTPYTRVSTLAKSLDNGEALTIWKQRMVARGLSARADLRALVQAAPDTDTRSVDQVVKQAVEFAQAQAKANIGTALHLLTERVDDGQIDSLSVDDWIMSDLRAYANAMHNINVVAKEVFVVVDDVQAAGTFDRLVEIDWRVYVADIKTGQHEPKYPHGVALQIAMYSRGWTYTPDAGRLVDLREHVDQERGVLIWLPSGQSTCEVYWLDIAAGWEMAKTAARVRDWRSSKPLIGEIQRGSA